MPKISLSDLKAMLASERADALAAVSASKLSSERADAMDYYLGDMTHDMPSPEGRSRAVSTDVADTIEGLMPSLMEIFCGGDEVVRFDPVGPEDVAAAEQETDYVNHVFMQANPGFLILYILYSFVKDALLSKVGVVKVWWEERTREERETYYDLPDDGYAILAADPDIEIVAHSARPAVTSPEGDETPEGLPLLHDVECVRARSAAGVKIEPVPPEEFGISRNARSLRDCDYAFHKVLLTPAKLIAQGYDKAQIDALPTYSNITNTEEVQRDTVNEYQYTGDENNKAARRIEVTEHYVRMDYEGDGKAGLYQVTSGGSQGDILTRDGKPDIRPIDEIPFAAMTPVIVTHRFFGRSIADLVMDIQRIKTALLRSMLDNAYLANNPRVEVAEQFASPETLDDLLVSRPGGIVRTRQPGGLNWQQVPSIAAQVFPIMEYMDATREFRTGVTRQGQGIDANSLLNQSATAVNQVFTAAQARMRLIARIFAETGIRDLFRLVHATIRKHGDGAHTVRLRNEWATVDPREWKTRNDMTVHVGLGTGGKSEQLAHIMSIIGLQREALVAGKSNLVTDQNLYNAARQATRLVGLPNVDQFFTDPTTQPAPQGRPDPEMIKAEAHAAQSQQQVQLTAAKQQADTQHEAARMQADAALAQQKFEHQQRMALLEHDLKLREHTMMMAARAAELAAQPGPDGQPRAAELERILGALAQASAQVHVPPPHPKGMRVVRDAAGRVSHVEPIG
jgi:hypothetical protein